MEDVRKHLGIDPTAKDYIGDSEVLQFILNAAQAAFDEEEFQRKCYRDAVTSSCECCSSDPNAFEFEAESLEDEQDYGLLQALRRIFQ